LVIGKREQYKIETQETAEIRNQKSEVKKSKGKGVFGFIALKPFSQPEMGIPCGKQATKKVFRRSQKRLRHQQLTTNN
jgi:hypothetical protein